MRLSKSPCSLGTASRDSPSGPSGQTFPTWARVSYLSLESRRDFLGDARDTHPSDAPSRRSCSEWGGRLPSQEGEIHSMSRRIQWEFTSKNSRRRAPSSSAALSLMLVRVLFQSFRASPVRGVRYKRHGLFNILRQRRREKEGEIVSTIDLRVLRWRRTVSNGAGQYSFLTEGASISRRRIRGETLNRHLPGLASHASAAQITLWGEDGSRHSTTRTSVKYIQRTTEEEI